ncbi:MAG: hypothetical protein JW727_00135 [Candidatus Aenigmarchaeota archaeon]|nr:hypothetical protein [Candidatus Aenigmarchaeota archaeon]
MRAELRVSAVLLLAVLSISILQFSSLVVHSETSPGGKALVIMTTLGHDANFVVGSSIDILCMGQLIGLNDSEGVGVDAGPSKIQFVPQEPGTYTAVCGSESQTFYVRGLGEGVETSRLEESPLSVVDTAMVDAPSDVEQQVSESQTSLVNTSADDSLKLSSFSILEAPSTLSPTNVQKNTLSLRSSSGQVLDANGTPRNFTEVFSLKWADGAYNLSWLNRSVAIEVFFFYKGQRHNYSQARAMFPGLSVAGVIINNTEGYKYSLNITGISPNLSEGLEYVGLEVIGADRLALPMKLGEDKASIIIGENLQFGFLDLAQNHTLVFSGNSTLLIGNVSNQSGLWLDPTIQLQAADTQNLRDTYVYSYSPSSNYGSSTGLMLRDRSTRRGRIYLMFNIDSVPVNVSLTDARFCMYLYNNGNTATGSIYHVTDHSWDGLTESNMNWTNQVCGVNFDDSADCNLTAEDSEATTSTGWKCWNVTKMAGAEYANGGQNLSMVIVSPETSGSNTEDMFCSKESSSGNPTGCSAANRPYLNITYADSVPPEYSGLLQFPSENSTYGQPVECNATWTDNVAMGTVYFESNYTGSWHNYTPSVSGAIYNYTIPVSELPAGRTVYWRYWANDTFGNTNDTMPYQNFTVQKATSTITLYLNGTDGDRSYSENSNANFTAELSVSGKVVEIWANFTGSLTPWQSGTSPLQNITNLTYSMGSYLVKANFSGDENYTSTETSHVVTITLDPTPPVISEVSPANLTFGLGSYITVRANVTDNGVVDKVIINLTPPSGPSEIYEMVNSTPDIYEYSFWAWENGDYYYTITANDTYGNIRLYDPYIYIYSNATLGISSGMAAYTPGEDVILASPSVWPSANLEMGTVQKKGILNDPVWVQLTYDNFESGFGSYTDGGADCELYTGGTYSHQGSNSVDIQDNTGDAASFYHTNNYGLDASGYTAAKVSFWYYATGFSAGEDFWLRYSNDSGSTWTTVASYVAGTNFSTGAFYNSTVYINDSAYPFTDLSKIRFQCDASNDNQDAYIDEVNFSATTGEYPDIEVNSTYSTYSEVVLEEISDIYLLKLTAYISSYNSSGSDERGNTLPYLEAEFYNGTSWVTIGNLSLNSTGNVSIYTNDSSIVSGWSNSSNRDIRIRAMMLDYYNSTHYDEINWTGIWVEIYNGSALANTGCTNLSGYLWAYVESNLSGSWEIVGEVINDISTATLRNIGQNGTLDIASLWNAVPWNAGQNPSGTYRARARFVDSSGNLLVDANGNAMEASGLFILTSFGTINATPELIGYGNTVKISAEVLDTERDKVYAYIKRPGEAYTAYEMTNVSSSVFEYDFNNTWKRGDYQYYVWSNNTDGYNSTSSPQYFYLRSDLSLTVMTENLTYGPNEDVNLYANETSWWNDTYRYRKKLNITNLNSTLLMEDGYSVNVVVDTASLVRAGKLHSSGDDLRIAWYNSTDQSWLELDRINETPFNSTSTEIWFETVEDLSASASDSNYYLYYSSPDAENPPANRSKIYLWWDDFSSNTLSLYSQAKWVDIHGNAVQYIAPNYNATTQKMDFDTGDNYQSDMYPTGVSAKDLLMEVNYYITGAYPTNATIALIGRIENPGATSTHYYLDYSAQSEYPSPGITVDSWTVGERSNTIYQADPYYFFQWNAVQNMKYAIYGDVHSVWINSNLSELPDIYARDSNHTSAGYFGLSPAQAIGWLDNYKVRRFVGTDPSVTFGAETDRLKSRIYNNGSTNSSGYLEMRVQRYSSGSWVNFEAPFVNDRIPPQKLRNLTSGQTLMLDEIWNPAGWNTLVKTPGLYRAYVRLTDASGGTLLNDDSAEVAGWYQFTILSSYLELTALKHENNFTYAINEYETGDNLSWINVTVINRNTTSINATITLNVLDAASKGVSWGPLSENSSCGDLAVDESCERQFDNSTMGYVIPLNATSGSYNFYWNVTMSSASGSTTQNKTLYFTLHKVYENTTSKMERTKIFQNQSTIYNFTITNPWSKNLTLVNVSVNLPELEGLNATCLSTGLPYCELGNLTGWTAYTFSFNVTTNNTPPGDYVLNATLNYTNPGNETHSWTEIRPQPFLIRIPGQFVIIDHSPSNLTRGEYEELRGYSNNTLDDSMHNVYLNWTVPAGWTNSTGNFSVNVTEQVPEEIIWNNVTVYVGIGSAIGPQTVQLRSDSEEGYEDWDTATVTVYAKTTISPLSTNNSNPVKGEMVRFSGKLIMDNGTGIPGATVSVDDETDDVFIGANTTDATGQFYIYYTVPETASLGDHAINASFAGLLDSYYYSSYNTTNITIYDKPDIKNVSATPETQGYGYNVTIRANITDPSEVSAALVCITPPSLSEACYPMENYTLEMYEYNHSDTWVYGNYTYYIWANNTAGKISTSPTYQFHVGAGIELYVKTLNSSYGPNEMVNLTPLSNWWNYSWSYRRPINITEQNNTPLTDYVINVTLDTQSLISAGKMKSDCSDVRVLQNETPIIYNVRNSTCNTPLTVVEFEVNLSASESKNEFYIYYGNPLASSNESLVGYHNDSDTVFLYHFTEGSGLSVYDYSGNGNNATLERGPQWSSSGIRFGEYAIYLPGSDEYIKEGTSMDVDDGTLEAWFKLDESFNSSSQYSQGLFGVWQDTSNSLEVSLCGQDRADCVNGGLMFRTESAGTGVDSCTATKNNWTAGQWYHIAVTWDGSVRNIYLDGTLNATCADNGISNFPTSSLMIGAARIDDIADDPTKYFKGTVDEVRGSNIARAPLDLLSRGIEPLSYFSGIEQNFTGQSIAYNDYAAGFKGYLLMKVQMLNGTAWQDIPSGNPVINDTLPREISSYGNLSLAPIWNGPGEGSGWNTSKETPGIYRVYVQISSPDGTILENDDGNYLNATYEFNITKPPSIIQLNTIRVYDVTDASDKKVDATNLTSSGLNTTFNLLTGKTYRVEIDLWNNDTSQSSWQIDSTDLFYHEGLNSTWNLSPSDNIWYSNGSSNFTGGNWTGGKVVWNTTLGGILYVNRNLTLYYVFEINSSESADYGVHLQINDTQFNLLDYSVVKVVFSESMPPQLYNNVYDVTRDVVHRGESFTVYGRWVEEIAQAIAEYNTTAYAFQNSTLALPSPNSENWTNYTLSTNSTWKIGPHLVKLYVSDMSGNWNNTLDYLPFEVWGWASVNQWNLSNSTITNGSVSVINCRVTSDNATAIPGYTVSFYNSTGLIGTNTTNSTGWASGYYIDYSLGYENLTCNITHDEDLYYNATSNSSRSSALRTVELTPPWHEDPDSNATKVYRGENITFSVDWHDNYLLDYAWLESNESGVLKNSSIAPSVFLGASSATASFDSLIPNNSRLGPMAWRVYANDSSSNLNLTSPFNYTEVWGYAIINETSLLPNPIYEEENTIMGCRVVDYHNGTGISGYQVSFYSNETGYLGSNDTNSTGWASWTYNDTTLGWEIISCNITSLASAYYDAHSPYNASIALYAASVGEDTTPPSAPTYGANDTSVWKGESLKVYAEWTEDVGGANVTYNTTTSALQVFTPDTISGKWTNHTIATNSGWSVGLHAVKINASDTWGNWNNTLSYLNFEVWGRSKVEWYSPTTDAPRGIISLRCRVYDKDNSSGISGYPVYFYNSTWEYMGTAATNASGVATHNWNSGNESPGEITFNCIISSSGYYNVSAGDDETSGIFNLTGKLNVTIDSPAALSAFHIGDTVTLNSTTRDEYFQAVTPVSATWNNSTSVIASGEDTSWAIPIGHALGPQQIRVNVSKEHYLDNSSNTSIIFWGWSNATWTSPDGGNANLGSVVPLVCRAIDANSSSPIASYPASFYYKNDTEGTYHFIGINLTNTSGHSAYYWATTGLSSTNYSVKCNITHNATLYCNSSPSNYANTTIELVESGGSLEVYLMLPPTIPGGGDAELESGYKVGRNRTFVLKANVTCSGGSCGAVQGTVRYNGSSENPDTALSTGSAVPFYVVNSSSGSAQNPLSCGNLDEGESCTLNWTINATGGLNGLWSLDALFDGASTTSNNTDDATIDISIVLIMALSSHQLNATVLPDTVVSKIPLETCPIYVSLNTNSNDAEGLYIRGTNLSGPAGYNISVGNLSYHTANLPGFSTPLAESYKTLLSTAPSGTNQSTYYWVNTPQGVTVGNYYGYIYIMANATS